jgi:hypothetical protein
MSLGGKGLRYKRAMPLLQLETLQQMLLANSQYQDEFFYDNTNSRVNDRQTINLNSKPSVCD